MFFLHPSLHESYAVAALNNYLRNTPNVEGISNNTKEDSLWTAYGKYITQTNPDYWALYMKLHTGYDAQEVVKKINVQLGKTKPYTTERALLHMQLFIAYMRMNKSDVALSHILLAAIDDVMAGNKSSSSLMRAVEYMLENDSELATEKRLRLYLALCTENVVSYRDVGRSIHVATLQKKLMDLSSKQYHSERTHLIIMIGVALLFALATCALALRYRRMARLQNRADSLQNQLTEAQAEMESVHESSTRYKGVMASQFMWLSHFMADMRSQKREISNLIAAGQAKEARRLASSSAVKDKSAALFNQSFDENFLAVFPDFISTYNRFMQPEYHVKYSHDKGLPPEVRICALISLGVNDSRTIAEILQYSVQTVYNYRMKLKLHCIDPTTNIDKALKG